MDPCRPAQWYEPAPPGYPWTTLYLPVVSGHEDAKQCVDGIKSIGNQCLKQGQYYDAIWKYSHALELCRERGLIKEMAVIHGNTALACLKMGDCFKPMDLPPQMAIWYTAGYSHACGSIQLDPGSDIIYKVYFRKAEAARRMLGLFPGGVVPGFPIPLDCAAAEAVSDYIHSHLLHENVQAVCEAIILAVDHGQTHLIPALQDSNLQSGFFTTLLRDVVSHHATQQSHINFVVLEMRVVSYSQPFDASSIQLATLLKKPVRHLPLLKKMFELGMTVKEDDVRVAVQILPDDRTDILQLILTNCKLESAFFEAVQKAAHRKSKRKLLACLNKHVPQSLHGDEPKILVAQIKDEGNQCFKSGSYGEALGKYFHALQVCREHGLGAEGAVIRSNCAQACMKMEMYDDAYTHCTECIRLDPTFDKGYFRRAEALRKILISCGGKMPPGSFRDVVSDYCWCHKIKQNSDALCEAVILGVNHQCTLLIPELKAEQIASGFSTELLQKLISRPDANQEHLNFVIFKLPSISSKRPFNAAKIEVAKLLKLPVTDQTIFERLFELGLSTKLSDTVVAVQVLSESHIRTLELILSTCNESELAMNTPCRAAMVADKMEFVARFIQKGATPPPEELKQCSGWPGKRVNHIIHQYLTDARNLAQARAQAVPLVPTGESEAIDPSLVERNKQLVTKLNEKAKKRFEKKEYLRALEHYDTALKVCNAYDFVEEAAVIHGSCAHLYLAMESYQNAYIHANSCVELNPGSFKGYARRAESLKRALQSPVWSARVPPLLRFDSVVQDYCACYAIKPDAKLLCEAVIVAVDHGCCQLLPLLSDNLLRSGFCSKLIQKLLSKREAKESHISFVVFDMCPRKQAFDASQIELLALLKKPVSGEKLIGKLLQCGVKATPQSVYDAVELLPASSVDTLKLIVSKCTDANSDILDQSCHKAFSARKVQFVSCLIEHGAKPPTEPTELLRLTLKQKNFDLAVSLLKTRAIVPEEVDLGELMTCTELINNPKIIAKLVDGGVSPNGCNKKPIAEVLKLSYFSPQKQIEFICLLLEKGDCSQLCHASKQRTTPLHVATELALKADGDTRIIDAVLSSDTFTSAGNIADEKGKTPLHIAVKSHWKREISSVVLSALVQSNVIDPWKKDCDGKRAIDFIKKGGTKDDRYDILDRAMQTRSAPLHTDPEKKKGKKGKRKAQKSEQLKGKPDKTRPDDKPSESVKSSTSTDHQQRRAMKLPTPAKVLTYEELTPNEKLERQIKRVFAKDAEYFKRSAPPVNDDVQDGQAPGTCDKEPHQAPQVAGPLPHNQIPHESMANNQPDPSDKHPPRKADSIEPDELPEGEDIGNILSEHGFNRFDELPWEVEVTNKVLKFFKDTKNNPPLLHLRAARTIFQLAEGQRGSALSKQVGSEPKLNLYESKMTRGGRILWEKAIQFSPRRTGTQLVYAEVIRVWDVVPDHDSLNRSIRRCVEQIESSHRRGSLASVRCSLQNHPQALKATEPVRGREVLEIPQTFLVSDPEFKKAHMCSTETGVPQFTPAASMKEDEYNVTTFYSFDTAVVKSMLTGTNIRRDFPYKEWPKEHEIINLKADEAILLLGRSGTGKTTCCLYRLWNEFKNYWDPVNPFAETKIPRKRLIHPRALQPPADAGSDTADSDSECYDTAEEDEEFRGSADSEMPQKSHEPSPAFFLETDEVNHREQCASKECESTDLSCELWATEVEVLDHLHQVFITKNYVLCNQMKKRFYDMAAAHEFLADHMEYEDADLPNSLDAISDSAFPLFITARQFYILLDNSLHDGRQYFERDDSGNLAVKISSSDYDHEDFDTLLDLEESDEEGVDEPKSMAEDTLTGLQQPAVKQHAKKRTEVTSLYFKEIIWPSISHRCGAKGFDPLLVWMEIQSFIKGSEKALRKGSPLLREEYKSFGNRMAPNFADHRDKIYDVFKYYRDYCQNQRHGGILFDECDLVQNLHRRLCDVKDVPWTIHSLYIDEVQDFTQAELALLIHCCRDPNSIFFTGDTAQSIMRGIAFRFQDLRSSFYRINQSVAAVKVPQEPYQLTINFRSHVGILKLATSIIDLLRTFFKGSIDDHLPEDTGMFPGPVPVLLESCEHSDLALLLSTNKREASAIEFGAHQVILVQSKEAKEDLPTILKGAIVLTIFEAKGLEFDDVLLYNFFQDSLVDEKGWRVVTSYLEMEEHSNRIVNHAKLPGSQIEPRSKLFDEKQHKSLSAELKYLYTAVTRTKCNLWIYDSDRAKRLPVFDYWHKRGLVKVVSTSEGGDSKHDLIFASISTPEQWKVQGDYFRKKHLWEQAQHCYEKSGQEYTHLAKMSNAYLLIQRARTQFSAALFRDAAVCLLECDQLHHDVQCITNAAICLRKTRPPRYIDAAKLFEKLGEINHAYFAYKKAKDIDSCVRLKECAGEYNDALKILSDHSKRKALVKAAEYESRGIKVHENHSTRELSYDCARLYARRKEKALLLEVLKYMSEIKRRVRFMKEAELYDEAYDVYLQQKQYPEAYRLASAQGWHQKGMLLARQQKDSQMEASFILQKATVEYCRQIHEGSLQRRQSNPEIIGDLHLVTKHQDPNAKAQGCLLLGIFEKDIGLCRKARETFKLHRHKVGEVEAFRAMADLTKNESIRSVLDACHAAREAGVSLETKSHLNQVVKDAVNFYSLQKVGGVYYIPYDQDPWIDGLATKCVCKDRMKDPDLDGMLMLDVNHTQDSMAEHCTSFIEKWLKDFKVTHNLLSKLNSFRLHREIKEKRFLSRAYSIAEVPAIALQGYLDTCIYLLELSVLTQKISTAEVTTLILSVFSPQVSVYLPLSNKHIETIRKSKKAGEQFQTWIKSNVPEQAADKIRLDPWLMAWRACCITVGTTAALSSLIEQQMEKINKSYKEFKNPDKTSAKDTEVSDKEKADSPDAKSERAQVMQKSVSKQSEVDQDTPSEFHVPETFVLWRNEDSYYHLFHFWLRSCQIIREEGRMLQASKFAIYHFLGNIAWSRAVISVMNVVDILSVHCTAIMAVLTHLNTLQGQVPFSFIVPLLYHHAVQVFDQLNVYHVDHQWLITCCAREADKATRRRNGLAYLRQDCVKLLWCSLDILLGKYSPRFNVLKFSLRTGAASHCLILALTIFGNLVLTGTKTGNEVVEYQRKLSGILQKAVKQDEHPKEYIVQAFQASVTLNFPHRVFDLVDQLLVRSKSNAGATLAKLQFNSGTRKVGFVVIPTPHHQPPIKQQAEQRPINQQPPHRMTLSNANSGTVPQRQDNIPQAMSADIFTPMVNSPAPSMVPPPPAYDPSSNSPLHDQSLTTSHQPQITPQSQLQTMPVQQPPFFYDQRDPMPVPHPERKYFHFQQPHTGFSHPTGAVQVGGLPTSLSSIPGSNELAPEKHNLHTIESGMGKSIVFLDTPAYVIDETSDSSFKMEGVIDYDHDEEVPRPPVVIKDQEDELRDQVNPEMIDPKLVDHNFCNVCDVILMVKQRDITDIPFDPEELDKALPRALMEEIQSDVSTETYWSHVQSEAHHTNVALYKKFSSDQESHYHPLMSDLHTVRQQCQSTNSPSLARTIDDITEEIERNERAMATIRHNWEQGIREISKMCDGGSALLARAHQQYEQVTKTTLLKIQDEKADDEELPEMGIDSDPELDAGYPGADVVVAARTEEQKKHSRAKKRGRRNRGGGK